MYVQYSFHKFPDVFNLRLAEPVASEGCYEHRFTIGGRLILFYFGVNGNSAAMIMFV